MAEKYKILKVEHVSTGELIDYFKWKRYRALDIEKSWSTLFTLPEYACRQLYYTNEVEIGEYRYITMSKEEYEKIIKENK